MDKSTLRARLLEQRKALADTVRKKASQRILAQITGLKAWQDAASVLLYLPVNAEVDTWPLFHTCLQHKHMTLLPCCNKDMPGHMDIFQVTHLDELSPGAFSIPEPQRHLCKQISEPRPDVILVPGVGFDRQGVRLGYGGGYYDRFFARHALNNTLVLGLAFTCQMVDELPHDPWDKQVHAVITEAEIIGNHLLKA